MNTRDLYILFVFALCLLYGCDLGRSPSAVGCPLRGVPEIQELGDVQADGECVYIEFVSPHSRRVCILGNAASSDEFEVDLPFLASCDEFPGASSMNSLIPKELLRQKAGETAFDDVDTYWVGSVLGRGTGTEYSIHAAYAQRSGAFFVDIRRDD